MAFVALIAVAFASADVTGSGTFGGVSGGAVASVEGEEIGTGEFLQTANSAYDQIRRENPQVDMTAFVDQGGLENVLQQLINSYVLQEFGNESGMFISKRLVDSEIAGISAFRGANGQFDETIFRRALQQQGLTEARIRQDFARGLMSDQLLTPASFGVRLPNTLAEPYANIVLEGREGEIAFIPSSAFFPKGKPTEKALKAFYTANTAKYRIAEKRTIRFATFQSDRFRSTVKVNDAEIAELYESRRAQYAPSEVRSLSQVIVPTQTAANALVKAVNDGASLNAAASNVGLSAASIDSISKKDYTGASSKAVADAVFATESGKMAKVAQSGLGWHVVQVRNIEKSPGQSLASVRDQLESELTEIKVREAVAQLTEEIEDRFADGATLQEVAEAEGFEIKTSPVLFSSGQAANDPGFQPDDIYQIMIPTAFALEEDSSAQLAEVRAGAEFVLFEVANVTPSAPPPLAQIRERVEQDYKLSQGSKAAKKLAESSAKSAKSIDDVTAAIRAANITAPPVEKIGTTRRQMSQLTQNGQRVPPPVALMFSMAVGTTKVLEAPNDRGWFVVHLRKINKGDARKVPRLVETTAEQLSGVAANEYREQFLAAIAKQMKIERNATAIKTVSDQLTGRNRDN